MPKVPLHCGMTIRLYREDKVFGPGVAELLEGAGQMAGKTKTGQRQDGAVQVIGALEKYGQYFADPGFKPIEH